MYLSAASGWSRSSRRPARRCGSSRRRAERHPPRRGLLARRRHARAANLRRDRRRAAGRAGREDRQAVDGFGDGGLRRSEGGHPRRRRRPFMLDSPPAVYKNILITGGSNTEGEPSLGLYGDIRGWDARTGRAAVVVPHRASRRASRASRPGKGESWKNRSGTNAWTYMTVDAGPRPGLRRDRLADRRFLRRRSQGPQPVWQFAHRARRRRPAR